MSSICPAVFAANYWFDTNQGTDGYGVADGGSYDWQGANFWNSVSGGGAGTYTTWVSGSGGGLVNDQAAGTTFTVTLGASDDQTVTVGGVLGLNWNFANTTALGAGNATIGGASGSGTLSLAANTHVGSAAGKLTINSAVNLQNRNLQFGGNNGAAASDVTINGYITGTGLIDWNYGAGGTLNLVNITNTFSGRPAGAIHSKTVTVTRLANGGQPSSIGTSTNLIPLNAGTLKFVGTGAQSTDLEIGFASGGGILDASGPTSADTISFVGPFGAGNLTLAGTNTGDNTIGGILNGGASTLTKIGSGTWVLTNQSTFAGATRIDAGLLKLSGGDNRLAPGSTIRVNGGTLDLGGHTQNTTQWMQFFSGLTQNGTIISSIGYDARGGTVNAVIAGSSPLYSRDNVVTLSATNTYTGPTTISSGWLDVSGLLGSGSYSGAITNVARLVYSGALTQEFGGVISGTGDLYKRNAVGTLTLTNANTYTGLTRIEAGTLKVTHPQGMGSNQAVYVYSSTLDLRADSNVTFGPGGVAANLRLMANGGSYTINVDRITGAGANCVLALGNVSNDGAYTVQLNITGGNGYSLQLGNILVSGADRSTIINPASANVIVGSVTGSAPDSRPSNLVLQGNLTAVGTVNGTIANGTAYPLALSKREANTWTLHGNNTYSGATTIDAGSLIVNGTHSGSGAWTLASGATLAGTGTVAGAITVRGIVSPGASDGTIGLLNAGGGVTWFGAASWSANTDWKFDLGAANASDLLNITGNFTKNTGNGSAFRFDFGGFTGTGTFKLVEWSGSTTFNAGDFSYINLPVGKTAMFAISGNQLNAIVSECLVDVSLTLGEFPSLCGGTTSATLPTTATNGTPDKYSIDYSDTANSVGGFLDVAPTALVSPIPVTVTSYAPAGIYTGTLYAIDTFTGCRTPTNFTVTVIRTPSTPGGISGSSFACANDTGLIYSISPVSSTTTYNWTVPSGATIMAGQGTTSITVNWGSSSGNVTVNAQNGCGTSANQTLAVTALSSVPGAPSAAAASEVSLDSFVANWSAGSGTTTGYRLDVATSIDFTSGFVVSNLTVGGTSYSLTGMESGVTYYYRVRGYNACGDSAHSSTITVLTPLILAGWNVSGLTGGSGNYGASPLAPATYADGQVTVVGLTRGPGVTQAGTAVARGWGGTAWNSVSAAAAISAGQYATCVVEALDGRSVSFISIGKLDYRRLANGPDSGVLQYSVDGENYVDISALTYASTASEGGSISVPIDLSGISALQGVAAGTPVTFRIVNYGASNETEPWYIYDVAGSSSHDFEIRGVICETPVAYNVTGGGTYCSDASPAGVAVGLANSQLRVSYQLYRNNGGSPVAVGSPRSGTGGAISFGLQAVADTYTVKATRNSGGCTADMTGSVSVSITTTPGAPADLQITQIISGRVDLGWQAPDGMVTGFNVKRAASQGGPYTTVTGGGNVPDLTFSDTSAISGNTYYYIITALNGGCEGPVSGEVQAIMPSECPTGYAPTMARPTNQVVLVAGTPLSVGVTAADSSLTCASPTMINSTLPSGMGVSDSTGAGSRTRQFTWTPNIDQVGTYPITVTATDEENLSTSVTFIVYVGGPAEPGNPPISQTNWSVVITNLLVPSSGNATVIWASVEGVQYDVYSSTLPVGDGAVWSKLVAGQIAHGVVSTTAVVSTGSMRFYHVVPAGQPATGRGAWGVVRPYIPSAMYLMSPPILGDLSLADNGKFGQALAAAVPEGAQIHLATSATPSWRALEKVDGLWRTEPGGDEYTTPLAAGQAFFIQYASGTTPVFSGPVGNVRTQTLSMVQGYNLIGISEGKGLAPATAFSATTMEPDPVGATSQHDSDQIVIQHLNGTWRRLVRSSTGTWIDMAAGGATTITLMPGEAYYYIRKNSGTTVSF